MAIIHMGKGRLWVVSSSQDLMEEFVGSVPCSRAPQQCIKGVSAPPITPPPCVCTGGFSAPSPSRLSYKHQREDDKFDTFEKGRQTNDEPVTLKHKALKPKVIEDEWMETWQINE